MARPIVFSPFPGRGAVLAELKRAGQWTPTDLARWARCNGGSEPAYAALAWWVRKGRISYTPNLWVYER